MSVHGNREVVHSRYIVIFMGHCFHSDKEKYLKCLAFQINTLSTWLKSSRNALYTSVTLTFEMRFNDDHFCLFTRRAL